MHDTIDISRIEARHDKIANLPVPMGASDETCFISYRQVDVLLDALRICWDAMQKAVEKWDTSKPPEEEAIRIASILRNALDKVKWEKE